MAADLSYHRLKYSSLVWVALGFCIFAIVGFYSARMTNDYPSYDAGRAEQRKITLAKVLHDENGQLNPVDDKGNPTAAWVDQDKGLIQIPIEEAMTHELPDLKNEVLGPGAAIPGAAPVAPPAPAPSSAAATNAAPAGPSAPTATNAAPVKPAPPAPPAKPKKKPAKTAPVTLNQNRMPVFKTYPIKQTVVVRSGTDFVVGMLIPAKPEPAPAIPKA